MTVAKMAFWLKVCGKGENAKSNLDFELPDEMKSVISEIDVTETLLSGGDTLASLSLPPKTLVIMVGRGGGYFIPGGASKLCKGDKLFVISHDESNLKSVCEKLNVPYYTMGENS